MKRRGHNRVFLGEAAFGMLLVFAALVFLAAELQRLVLRAPQSAAVISAVLVDLSNHDRAARGLQPLHVNAKLTVAAQAKANDMATKGYFAHVSPENITPWHWFDLVGYDYAFAGENLAINFADSGDVESAWMHSPTHRDNILSPAFEDIGVATAVGTYRGKTVVFVVQEFGTPATKAEEASPLVAAQGSAPGWWWYVLSFPRTSARIAFGTLALCILFALGIDTGFELHKRHRAHALYAGMLLLLLLYLALAVDHFVFVQPMLPPPA